MRLHCTMKEEWRIFKTKNPKLKDRFLCGFIDKKKTEARKCVRCKSVFSCKKSNTSALERHISSCTSTESEDVNQISIRKFLNSNTEKFRQMDEQSSRKIYWCLCVSKRQEHFSWIN